MEKSTIAGEEDIARLVDTFAREHITSKKYLDDCHSALDQKLAGVKMQQLQLKLNETLKDIEQMLDRKMYYIHLLTAEYAECEEQYQRRVQTHCDIIDYFSKAFCLFAEHLEKKYENDCIQLISQLRSELEYRRHYDECQKINHENIRDANNMWTENQLGKIRQKCDHDTLIMARESVIKQEIRRVSAVDYIKSSGEITSNMLESIRANFGLHGIEEKYENLFRANEVERADIEKHEIMILSKRDMLRELEKEMQSAQSIFSTESSALNEGKTMEFQNLRALELEAKEMEHSFGVQLKHLVVRAHESQSILEAKLKTGNLLIGLLDSCKQYQTQAEKIGRPHTPTLNKSGTESADSIDYLSPEAIIVSNVIAAIKTENYELLEEKQEIEKENHRLRDEMRAYCEYQKYNECLEMLQLAKGPSIGVPKLDASQMNQLPHKHKRSLLYET